MKVKICGITKPSEACYLKEVSADFAGVVMFYEKSKRCVDIFTAKKIVDEFKVRKNTEGLSVINGDCENESVSFSESLSTPKDVSTVKTVAVTVCPNKDQLMKIYECGFDYVQIHGNVEKELLEKSPLPVFKAFNVSDIHMYETYKGIDNVKGFVFDAATPGSGETFDKSILKSIKRDYNRLFILAGGLNENNVAELVKDINPDCVDVSSGVEICKEKPDKDMEKIKRFVNVIRQ